MTGALVDTAGNGGGDGDENAFTSRTAIVHMLAAKRVVATEVRVLMLAAKSASAATSLAAGSTVNMHN
eukprot:14620110-Alexandrium_andersonii.AAC.1